MMISTLNKQGIEQLLQQNHGAAIQTFRLLLDLVRKYARTVSCCTHRHCRHAVHLQARQIRVPQVTANGAIFFPIVFCRTDEAFEKREEDSQDDDDDDEILQSACFSSSAVPNNKSAVSHRPTNCCKQCQRTVCLLSVVVCYNLAMAYHCQSLQSSRDRSTHVKMAVRYCRHALKLAHQQQALLDHVTRDSNGNNRFSRNDDGSGILLVALGNNFALLLAELGDFAGVHTCVSLTLSHLPDKTLLLVPFRSNAIMWQLTERQPSPAA